MNTGRTTSFFGCFLVGILMSKNNYDKIDVFLSSFLVVSDEKARESIFFGFSTAVRLKNVNFYIVIIVNILYQNNELSASVKLYFLCNLYNFVFLCHQSLQVINKMYVLYFMKMDIISMSILFI